MAASSIARRRVLLSQLRLLGQLALSLGLAAMPMSAHAADASPWSGDALAPIRLLAGSQHGPSSDRIVRAGIEMRLAPGWKTYWRSPGDAGVPPQFDFSGSENIKSVTILWPAPQRFSEADLTMIGYKGTLILPLHIVRQEPARPVVVRAKVDYGICENVCVPVSAKVELVLSGAASSEDDALAAAEARVPKRVVEGEVGAFAIEAVRRMDQGSPQIVADVRAPGTAMVDLFAEGPTSDWSLSVPKSVSVLPNGLRRFSFQITGGPSAKAVSARLKLKLTATAEDEAIETVVDLE